MDELFPKGLIAEATCIVNVAEAECDVHMVEKQLAHCHVKESILKARLYRIQTAMANGLVQILNSHVRHAHAGRGRIAKSHVWPYILSKVAEMHANGVGNVKI